MLFIELLRFKMNNQLFYFKRSNKSNKELFLRHEKKDRKNRIRKRRSP